MPSDQTTNPGWRPRTVKVGPILFGLTRAVSGEWAVSGVVTRLSLQRGKRSDGWHLLIGPWCLSMVRTAA